MKRVIRAKMFDGKDITIPFTDLGDTMPVCDINGSPYGGYTTRFNIGGSYVYSQVDRLELDARDANDLRTKKDYAVLQAAGVDISTIEVIEIEVKAPWWRKLWASLAATHQAR